MHVVVYIFSTFRLLHHKEWFNPFPTRSLAPLKITGSWIHHEQSATYDGTTITQFIGNMYGNGCRKIDGGDSEEKSSSRHDKNEFALEDRPPALPTWDQPPMQPAAEAVAAALCIVVLVLAETVVCSFGFLASLQ